MSDYSQITFFTPKDSLATGNPNKIIYGSDVDAELSAISTAIATKADVDGDAIGAGTPATELSVDNLKLDANKIISTNTDGDIELEPNGAGYVVITNVDVNAGNIDNTVIGATTAAAGTFTTANATTVDTTNLEVTNLKAKDGTAAGSIADVTGVVTLASSVLTTTDINGGTIDGAIIGGATPAAITGTTLTANTSLALATGATVTAILDEDTMTSNSATALATQQSIKAYVDSQVTAQDLDVTTDSGTIAIDLDSETLTVAGGTGLDTSAVGNTVTVAIDSTVATLTGAQTLTNKVLTSPDINTPDIDGGTIDGTVIGASSPAAATFTTGDFNTSLNVDGTITADGLTVGAATGIILDTAGTNEASWTHTAGTGSSVINVGRNSTWGGDLTIQTDTKNRLNIESSGDISFYEDTGTTAKFFWDASAESLGIGTSSPAVTLHVNSGSNGEILRVQGADAQLRIDNSTSNVMNINSSGSGDSLALSTNDTERMRIDSNGNTLLQTGGAALQWQNGYQTITGDAASNNLTYRTYANHIWKTTTGASSTTDGTERMRIDSSGNVGIGVVPATDWSTSYHALQVGSTATFMGAASGSGEGNWISNNAIFSTSGSWEYLQTASASSLDMQSSTAPFRFRYAASGTAGTAISWSEAMRIDTSGNLLVGRSGHSGYGKLNVEGGADFTGGNVLLCRDTGNVGIGTSSPSTKLTVASASFEDHILLDRTGVGSMHITATNPRGLAFTDGTTQFVTLAQSTGNVGIGTSSIGARLTLGDASSADSTNLIRSFRGAGTSTYAVFGDNGGGAMVEHVGGGSVFFKTGGSERARIDSSGNLLVGTTSAAATAGIGTKIIPNTDAPYISTVGTFSTNSAYGYYLYSTGAGAFRCYIGYGGTIYATSTSITAISDASLKENVRDLDKGLDTILALKPRRFDWKNGDGNDIMGFVAQEVEEVLPELVHDYQYNETETKLGLKMGDMLPSLVKAIQEQQEIINDLRARVAQLEGV